MNKTVENILVGGAVLLTSPIWIPVELVKGAKEYFIDSGIYCYFFKFIVCCNAFSTEYLSDFISVNSHTLLDYVYANVCRSNSLTLSDEKNR